MVILLFYRIIFQSTLPYGSERPEFLGSHSSMIFQSTLPYGSENIDEYFLNKLQISIHAPLRERECSLCC